jgi:hypothetical protein
MAMSLFFYISEAMQLCCTDLFCVLQCLRMYVHVHVYLYLYLCMCLCLCLCPVCLSDGGAPQTQPQGGRRRVVTGGGDVMDQQKAKSLTMEDLYGDGPDKPYPEPYNAGMFVSTVRAPWVPRPLVGWDTQDFC